jgi:hypothetical protein
MSVWSSMCLGQGVYQRWRDELLVAFLEEQSPLISAWGLFAAMHLPAP